MKKLFGPLIRSMVLIGMALSIGTPVFAQANIKEEVMVPKAAGVGCRVGPNGLHIACVAPKGSHSVIYFDGVEQPRFDALLLPTGSAYIMGPPNMTYSINDNYGGPVVFSPDGTHWAYAARQGDNYIIIKDGQQIDSAPYNPSVFGSGGLMFSPAGNRLYYIICDNTPNNTHLRFMIDGKAEPWSKGLTTILFSPDGAHYTYTGVADDNTTQWSVIDGKQIHYLGDKVQFTDTDHLLSVYYDNDSHTSLLIADGKAVMKANSIPQVWISPKGTLTLAMVQGKPNDPPFLTVNRQLVPGTAGLSIRGVYFSPDGQHYAALCHTTNNTEFILEDGKKGEEYPSIDDSAMKPMFSPDSSKFLYVAASGSQRFLVTNGDESDGFQTLTPKPVFTPDGQHLAYGTTPFGSQSVTIYVDGKALPVQTGQPRDTFNFSPDGSRYAYTIGNGTLAIDGVTLSNMYVTNWQSNNPDTTVTTYFYLFSPDSKHIAYIAQDPNGGNRGLWLDQKLVFKTTQTNPDHIAFSSDSQHLFWTLREAPDAVMPGNLYHHTLYVDGKNVKEYQDSFFDSFPGAWKTQDNVTLQFFTIADSNIKRYTVTPGADTNVTTLLASATSAKN